MKQLQAKKKVIKKELVTVKEYGNIPIKLHINKKKNSEKIIKKTFFFS